MKWTVLVSKGSVGWYLMGADCSVIVSRNQDGELPLTCEFSTEEEARQAGKRWEEGGWTVLVSPVA